MAVYFDKKLNAPSEGFNTKIAWHTVSQLLAVAVKGRDEVSGEVNIYSNEGELMEDITIQKQSSVSYIEWHPHRDVLAVGWDNGEIIIWLKQDNSQIILNQSHKTCVSVISWNGHGNSLVSGDENGHFVIWKADMKGCVQKIPVQQYDISPMQSITNCVFKSTKGLSDNLSDLARAAVSGDENALDRFNWGSSSDKKGESIVASIEAQAYSCYFGGSEGAVWYFDGKNNFSPSFSVEGPILFLSFFPKKGIIVAITKNLMLSQFGVSADGVANEISQVKLTKGNSPHCDVIWTIDGILATTSGENLVRMWDLNTEKNYKLRLEGHAFTSSEHVSCIAYDLKKGILAAGTNNGRVVTWKRTAPISSQDDNENCWEMQTPTSLETGDLLQIGWDASGTLIATRTGIAAYILSEQIMSHHFGDDVAAIQVSPSQLSIYCYGTQMLQELKTDIHIKGIFACKDKVAVWNGSQLVIYEVSRDKQFARAAGSFSTNSFIIALHADSVYIGEGNNIQVRNFQGIVKQLLTFAETEGDPVVIDICGNYLCAASSAGYIKVFDLSRREARQHCNPKFVAESIPKFSQITSIRCNCSGSKVSFITRQTNGDPSPVLYVWETEVDSIQGFDFCKWESTDHRSKNRKNNANKEPEIQRCIPVNHYWDSKEVKLLACELIPSYINHDHNASLYRKSKNDQASDNNKTSNKTTKIATLFSTPENGVVLQESSNVETSFQSLLGIGSPYYFFLKKLSEIDDVHPSRKSDSEDNAKTFPYVGRVVMRDFIGLEDSDETTMKAMMNFSFNLTTGNMDEAFKAIKAIKSETVWENLARMCIKTRRLDVASVCLGNMGHARGSRALREAKKEPEIECQLATLAIQLGQLDEAEKLYKECNRFDLLNNFYQASGQWKKAIDVAERFDRIHLRTTHYNFAKQLEAMGQISTAISEYEKAGTQLFDVPRLLLDDLERLRNYVLKSQDPQLKKWWAQYMEGKGELEEAIRFYESAHDSLSLVRIYCYSGDIDKAAEIANTTGDLAASYHLARQHENEENEMEGDLMNLALLSSSRDMVDVATFYESKQDTLDKAIVLYYKGGEVAKALDLCFQAKQFSTLETIAESLDENTDPAILNQCSTYLIEHGRNEKAIDLLVLAKKYYEALELCMEHNIIITEEVADKMTISKESADNEYRNQLLEKIAECAMQQGSYHLATKKFTQASNKIKAMKSLLKSGDTEKIIFFAGVSRQREIYIMAANYLQSLDWRKDSDVMKNIITFYTKGRALDLLSGFYVACAQVEIDEYQNYQKAFGALTEAYKCLSKAKVKNPQQQEDKLVSLKQRATLIKKFIQAKKQMENEPNDAVNACQALIDEPDIDSAVRIGDIYGTIISHYVQQENYSKAHESLEELRKKIPSMNILYYVNMKTIESIHKALDIPLPRNLNVQSQKTTGVYAGSADEDDGEEVDEEVIEEEED
ncbi:uncharacterized protein TRIADDRAFT_60914 [Trichoplax adhaerens]|uniref:Uncharacterized protein n=1 Tax=Trichoplax adhaerens TaxID=10228 RepID=B3S9H9_TRIAD|nr:hypothetical protein TRIADDRAFT_60914 [Trichoplax adhaerens]EDV20700.1 hypothetical protein TRIADDRAFT_60914 [Trichoplax adhaerens]|eukprot:XP_002116900.1 hypothetical protein TRIADDRAFT_60914 [Trichoplax adhaerens]